MLKIISWQFLFGLLGLIHLTRSLSPPQQWASFTTIPAPAAVGPSTARFTSSEFGLDSTKFDKINSTSFEWWYFDVVSEDQKSSAVIIFFASPEDGFPLSTAPDSDITDVFMFLSTPQNESLIALPVFASRADILSVGNGASGVWEGAGFSFIGTPDMSFYSIAIDSPEIGIKGLITFESVWC